MKITRRTALQGTAGALALGLGGLDLDFSKTYAQASLHLAAETPEEAAWALVEAANQAGGNDNITTVVVDVVE